MAAPDTMGHMRMLLLAMLLVPMACYRPDFDPSKARAAYPYDLHSATTIPVEVFRDGTTITIMNSTAGGWVDATVWINQRFSAPISGLAAGQMIEMNLVDFRDNIGESFPAGGLWATRRSMPVRLVELQANTDGPLVGLIAIRQNEFE
jgi:hypothetical protein